MVILLLVLKVGQFGCLMQLGIIVEILYLIKLLQLVMQHHYLIVQQLQEFSTEYSRGDHVHPLNVTSTIPISDSASGSVGTDNYYARSDHSHPINITTTIPPQDSASGSVDSTNYYARNDHSHPINVETNASNIPIVNGVGANGTSAFYARQDHVHPQQLTYDGNVTATKFIKTGGTSTDILLADGSTKKSEYLVTRICLSHHYPQV
ncbi:MAG: hypothetical protein EZS28_040364 [Streblomastix strix]|uniref:Uncharacterized protein n=1 Tax=Streblomastix strix TaxID=222440 RepID=A0A5J4U1E8_9EUKA|nr:MAG: hypothetical protein EZS28_040364 [Streblomastix strix]